MTTINTATAIKNLTLAVALGLALTVSVSARAATTFPDAMNQGIASFQAQDFSNAIKWFNYAKSMRPNDRGATFWVANSAGFMYANSGYWERAANCWKRCVSLYPATANQLNPKIAYASRAAQNQFQANVDDVVSDLKNIVKFMVAIAPLF